MSSGTDRVKALLHTITAATDAASEVDSIREYLKLVRELRLRQSDTVATYGSMLLRGHKKAVPEEEYWTVAEQVTEAALDVHALDFAFSVLVDIRKKFPGSQRAQRLTAMYLEAKGKHAEAEGIITKLLEDHPDSQYALRRQVALERTKGNLTKAIELLRAYVDTFMTDKDGWEELADLYLQAQLYGQAAFCYEELLLHSPQSVPLHIQYADVLYTIGGPQLRTARQHYAAAAKLSGGDSLRALYGLTCTAAALAGQKAKAPAEDEALTRNAVELLQRRYTEENEAQLPFVKDLLRGQAAALFGRRWILRKFGSDGLILPNGSMHSVPCRSTAKLG